MLAALRNVWTERVQSAISQNGNPINDKGKSILQQDNRELA